MKKCKEYVIIVVEKITLKSLEVNVKKKTLIFLVAAFLLLLAMILGWFYWKSEYSIGSVGTRIIDEIDKSSDEKCFIELNTVTDFEWDTVVVMSADFLAAGYSDETVSKMFGVSYEMPDGFRSRLIFVNDGKIVHEESYRAEVEHSSKFNINIQHPYYVILTSDDCDVVGSEADGYYSIFVE